MSEVEAPRGERRRGRIWITLALLAFAGALFAGIVELSTKEPIDESLIQPQGAADAQRIFGGIRQFEDRLGDPDAPVSIQLFTDMQCKACAEQFFATVPELVERYVRPGDAQLLYRHYSFSQSSIELGFLGAEAAGAQSYLWQYVYIFFASLDEAERLGLDVDFLRNLAASISELNVQQWQDDYTAASNPDSAVMRLLAGQEDLARSLGLRAKPSLVITGPAGTEILQDSPELQAIEAAIDRVS